MDINHEVPPERDNYLSSRSFWTFYPCLPVRGNKNVHEGRFSVRLQNTDYITRGEDLAMKDEHPLLDKQAKDLEDAFFAKESERLLRELQAKAKVDEKRKALSAVVEAQDPAIIDHLLELGVGPESVMAVGLVPLAAVAWADGRLDDKERKTILKAASERGIEPGSANYTMLEFWLKERPDQRLLDAWKKYARAIFKELTEHERVVMRESIVGKAREIAEAAGGFLGIQSISPQEKALLEELEKVLS
jgi:hypothetical protein